MRFEKVSEKEAARHWYDQKDWIEMVLPCRSTANAAGYDFFLPCDVTIQEGERVIVPTFIKAELDADKVLEIYPRSSYGIKKGVVLANTVGIIDADYYNNSDNEGHILVCLYNTGSSAVHLCKGERFCQGIIKQFFLMDGDRYGMGAGRIGGIGSSGR